MTFKSCQYMYIYYSSDCQYWYKDELRHREDGPAAIYSNGYNNFISFLNLGKHT